MKSIFFLGDISLNDKYNKISELDKQFSKQDKPDFLVNNYHEL